MAMPKYLVTEISVDSSIKRLNLLSPISFFRSFKKKGAKTLFTIDIHLVRCNCKLSAGFPGNCNLHISVKWSIGKIEQCALMNSANDASAWAVLWHGGPKLILLLSWECILTEPAADLCFFVSMWDRRSARLARTVQ